MSQYQTAEKDGVLLITCPEVVETDNGGVSEASIKTWLLSPAKVHVIDFKDVTAVKSPAYRMFVIYNQQLKANSKSLFVVNVKPQLMSQFKQDGLTSVFNQIASIDEAKKKANPPKPASIDVEFINPFIAATRSVLETQAQCKLTPGKATVKKIDDSIPMDIAGVLSIDSDEFSGSINLCFKKEVFLKIYENLTGEKHTDITSETQDAAAELLNMIFGQAKTTLNDQKGYMLDRAMPSVLTGEKLKEYHFNRSSVIVVPFESTVGAFHLEIMVEK